MAKRLDKSRKSTMSMQYQPSRSSTLRPRPTTADPKEMEDLRTQYWSSQEFTDLDNPTKEKFYVYLKRYSQQTARSGDYKSASIAQNMYLNLRDELDQPGKKPNHSYENRAAIEERKKTLSDIQKKTVEGIQTKFAEKREEMTRKHAYELHELESKWSETKILLYSKPSTFTLNQLTSEKSLIDIHDIDSAKELNVYCQALLQQDTEANQTKYEKDYQAAKDTLLNKQQNELDYLALKENFTMTDFIENVNRQNYLIERRKEVLSHKNDRKIGPDYNKPVIYHPFEKRPDPLAVSLLLNPIRPQTKQGRK